MILCDEVRVGPRDVVRPLEIGFGELVAFRKEE
jgi:hypothetical protein